MKCAWFFSTNPALFKAAAEMNSPYLNTLGMIAGQAAYAGGEDWMHQCVAYLDANQEFANQYIKANIPMIKVGRKPEGTYLGWIDVTAVSERIGARKSPMRPTAIRPAIPGPARSNSPRPKRWSITGSRTMLSCICIRAASTDWAGPITCASISPPRAGP